MLGRRVVDAGQSRGLAVRVASGSAQPGPAIHRWDISVFAPPLQLLDWQPTHIIHTAALTDVDLCETDPARAAAVNVAGTSRVRDLAASANARLIHVSTDSVFDGTRGWYSDHDEPVPVNEYGRSKLGGERVALEYANAVVARTNIVGPERLTAWILESARTGDEIQVFHDVVFNPLDVFRLADDLLNLSFADVRGIVHFGTDDSLSKAEYARRLVEAAGLDKQARLHVVSSKGRFKVARPLNTTLIASDWVIKTAGHRSADSVINRVLEVARSPLGK